MKKDDKKKLFAKDTKTLNKEIFELRSEIAHLNLTFDTNRPKNVNEISNKKKKLAIMLTALKMSGQKE